MQASVALNRSKLEGEGYKYHLMIDSRQGTFQEFFHLLTTSDETLLSALQQALTYDFEAVFWECAPTTAADFPTQAFEFVVLPAPALALRRVNMSPFREKFAQDNGSGVVAFSNLGGDSTLVVPCPRNAQQTDVVENVVSINLKQMSHMTHLSAFLRGGEPQHVRRMWARLGAEVAAVFASAASASSTSKRWVSTSGLGVSLLHLRVVWSDWTFLGVGPPRAPRYSPSNLAPIV
jgi:hypothetical protein